MSRQPAQQYGPGESIGRTSSTGTTAGQPTQQGIGGQAQQFGQPQTFGEQSEQYGQSPMFGGQSEQYGQPQTFGAQEQQFAQQPQAAAGGQFGQPGGMGGVQQPGSQLQGPPAGQMGPGQEAHRDVTLEDGISDEMRVALHDFVQAATVCEWCAEQCLSEGPQMAECVRLCRDVADLASLNVQLLSRDSVFGPEAAEVFAAAADACAQECARHAHKHCQECAEVLPRAARSTRKMLASFEGGGQQAQAPQIQGQGTQLEGGPGGSF